MATFCHYVLYFTSPATAAQWTAAHPGTFVISLEEAAELARRHAARIFADALRVLSRFALRHEPTSRVAARSARVRTRV